MSPWRPWTGEANPFGAPLPARTTEEADADARTFEATSLRYAARILRDRHIDSELAGRLDAIAAFLEAPAAAR